MRRATLPSRTALEAVLFLSTLSLRRATSKLEIKLGTVGISIHALLAESDTSMTPRRAFTAYFYPRSPCGERHDLIPLCWNKKVFLSTLSLRRATRRGRFPCADLHYFYPRSPCGERLLHTVDKLCLSIISIHALLAESDPLKNAITAVPQQISIHALLAESDNAIYDKWLAFDKFLSTLSLRRATYLQDAKQENQ